ILANDRNTNRVAALAANCYRTGCVNVQTVKQDGRDLSPGERFDRVLVDVPCSAEGNARTQEELRDGASMHDIESVSRLQEQLLDAAVDYCREGGTVVYSTCTFAPEENEQVVETVLDRVDVEPLSFDFPHTGGVTEWNGETLPAQLENCVRVYPHQLDSGGIFVARLAK
ncbi:MAG: RsmB/NOP family class I SAM-dependent RNA methyltransferase, partial [Candidatus Nanohaloarchaea archaeon]|nr:RsmB/NOP family class I SAM-dependent RNA methyltransferase [Candidatus Nanohaloarchaea archaeon]